MQTHRAVGEMMREAMIVAAIVRWRRWQWYGSAR